MTPERRVWPHHESCDIYDRPPEFGRPATGDKPCNCYVVEITALTDEIKSKDEELKRLLTALEDAPHGRSCSYQNSPICDCWKKDALEPRS